MHLEVTNTGRGGAWWRNIPGNTEVRCRSLYHWDRMWKERVNVISVGEPSAQLRQTQLTQSHPIDLYYNSQEWVGSPGVDAGAERCHKTPHCYALSVYPYCVCHSPLVSLLCIFQLLNFILQLPIIYQFQCLLRGVFSCQITSFHPWMCFRNSFVWTH